MREVAEGWDAAFAIAADGNDPVILIIGSEPVGELESQFELLARSGMSALPPTVQELLKGT